MASFITMLTNLGKIPSFMPLGVDHVHVLSLDIFLMALLLVISFTSFLFPGGLAWTLLRAKGRARDPRSAIPGPSGLPVIGLVLAFTGHMTHRVLDRLSRALGARKLMAFSAGFTPFIVSSDPGTAREILNSSAFADRPVKASAYELLFHRAMGFAPFGKYWRNLRRISATHLFSPRRIASSGEFRREIGLQMVGQIKEQNNKAGEVEVRKILHFGSLNNVMMSVFGRRCDFSNGEDEAGKDLEGLVREGYELLGTFNWSDHFPLLGWFDFQGVRKRCRKLVGKVNVFVDKIIEDHRVRRNINNDNIEHDDFVDVLLDLEEESKLSDSDMIAVLWEMIFRGTDTVAILLEWIMARMVLHPDIQAKAQAEIDTAYRCKGRPISDSDLPNLPFLRAIVKETLRIHPPGPLLSWARLAIHDINVGGYHVPAGTTAIVNMWAISHDEGIWPEEFKPERFIKEDVPIFGSDLRLAPFGSGTRVCPGKAMGLATVELWLAQLLQRFKWVPTETGVDLSERLKLSMEMKHSLVCKAIPRTQTVRVKDRI